MDEITKKENNQPLALTKEQIELIKKTIAVGATDDEFKLFLYTAKKRGLDPLLKQIYFVKRKRKNPETGDWEDTGSIQTGIDGFRVIADRTEKLAGIKRGIIRDGNQKIAGAWAEVYRNDWSEPAREEVSFSEYCQTNSKGEPTKMWRMMPETMIKKCAESAALRMAFPQDLSGLYTHEEMAQADSGAIPEATIVNGETSPPPEKDDKRNWSAFWAAVKKLGFTRGQVHELAKVESMKDFKGDLDMFLKFLEQEKQEQDKYGIQKDKEE